MTLGRPITERLQSPQPGAYIQLYSINLLPLGGPQLFFTPSVVEGGGNFISYGGTIYTPIQIEAEGFEKNGRSALPQPKIRLSNTSFLISSLVVQYDNLIGCEITRTVTFRDFLDDGSEPDPQLNFGTDRYLIEQKTAHTREMVEFSLSSHVDQHGTLLPRRQILRKCTRTYRRFVGGAFDYTGVTCPYTGTASFDINNTPTTQGNDRCSRDIVGCKLRFPYPQPLPSRAFPGVSRLRLS